MRDSAQSLDELFSSVRESTEDLNKDRELALRSLFDEHEIHLDPNDERVGGYDVCVDDGNFVGSFMVVTQQEARSEALWCLRESFWDYHYELYDYLVDNAGATIISCIDVDQWAEMSVVEYEANSSLGDILATVDNEEQEVVLPLGRSMYVYRFG